MKSDINNLIASEKRFRMLIENSADALILIDLTGIVKYQSPAYVKLTGRGDLQRIGRDCLEFIHPNDRTIFNHALDSLLRSPDQSVNFTLRNQHINGKWLRLECIANNLLNEPLIEGIVVNIHNITDQWFMEEALRESERLYSDLIVNQAAGIYRILIKRPDSKNSIWDSLTHEFVSDRFCEIIGIEKSQISKMTASLIIETIHPDDREDFILSNEASNRNMQPFVWEGRIIINNTIKWIRFDSNPRKLVDGSIRWTGIVIEITRQKQVEEQLKKNSNRLRKLNNCLSALGPDYDRNINELTTLCGELLNATCALYNRLENNFLYCAGKWQLPKNYLERDQSDGHICYDVILKNSDQAITISNLKETKYAKTDPNVLAYGLQTYCGQVVRNEGVPVGSLCVVYNNDFEISDEDSRIIGIIGSAIGNEDNRKFRNEALKANQEKLKDLNETKDKFFSIIAHDLKGPVSGIIGISALLKEEAKNLDIATIVQYAELINTSSLQTHQLLDNLLKWARLQEGKISFNPVTCELHLVVDEVILLLSDVAKRKKLLITNNVPTQLIVNADTEMLKTILRNLISNAIKFTPTTGKIEIKTSMRDSEIEIVVADNGVGIKAENISKLFMVDIAFSTHGTENERGTGFGLILCKEFVERHGGIISVESIPDCGSQFKFTLPYNSNC
jgi:PAS domain S-box-containing protein